MHGAALVLFIRNQTSRGTKVLSWKPHLLQGHPSHTEHTMAPQTRGRLCLCPGRRGGLFLKGQGLQLLQEFGWLFRGLQKRQHSHTVWLLEVLALSQGHKSKGSQGWLGSVLHVWGQP